MGPSRRGHCGGELQEARQVNNGAGAVSVWHPENLDVQLRLFGGQLAWVEQHVGVLFDYIDTDRDGRITFEELHRIDSPYLGLRPAN